jgi:hypothetical protein
VAAARRARACGRAAARVAPPPPPQPPVSGALPPAQPTHPPPPSLHPTAAAPRAAARLADFISYEDLEPYANVVDVRAAWRRAGLPPPPPVLCHVGVLGWHCHNTTLNPWNPASLVPKDKLPPMPADASCVICPRGWSGARGSLVELMLDLPMYVRSRGQKLPPGMWDGEKLLAAEVARLEAAAAGGGGGSGARANATAPAAAGARANATAPAGAKPAATPGAVAAGPPAKAAKAPAPAATGSTAAAPTAKAGLLARLLGRRP